MATLSKNKIKLIHSLEMKKYRKENRCFLAEGPKLVEELLPSFRCLLLAATTDWLSNISYPLSACEVIEVSPDELAKASLQKSPQQVLALFELPDNLYVTENAQLIAVPRQSLCLALDGVQDPGNLGTIIRLADWFGIEQIFCSLTTADAFSPKCVQATMGALARVKVHYTPLPTLIESMPDVPIYATLLDGKNLYEQPLTPHGLIIMGNEGNGISEEVRRLVNRKLFIPNYPPTRKTSESLNVAIATAIVCAEFRRQAGTK